MGWAVVPLVPVCGTVMRRRRPRPLGRGGRGRPRRTLGRATAGILRGGCPCSCSSRGISTVSPGIRDWSVAPSVLHRHGKRVCGPIGGPCCCDRPRRASDSASSGLSLADRDPKAWPGAPAQPVPLARSRDARRCGRSRPLLARPEGRLLDTASRGAPSGVHGYPCSRSRSARWRWAQ